MVNSVEDCERHMAPLKRTPIRKVRSKPRPGRLKGPKLESLRMDCWDRDKGLCQRCGKKTHFYDDHEHPDSFHMAHRRNKAMWGDNIGNVQTECGDCHRKYHQRGPSMDKPCPPKPLDTN